MRKAFLIFMFISLIFVNSGCQEIGISIQYNKQEINTEKAQTANKLNITPTSSIPAPTRTPYLPTQESSQGSEDTTYDPHDYFFPDNLLPEDISFHVSDTMIFNVSHLFEPGNLSGIAYVKLYQASAYSLTIEEIIVQSSAPTSPESLKAGHHNEYFLPDSSDQALGDYAMVLTSMMHASEKTYHYHFYKDNTIVLLSLGGMDPFVSKENVYMLAQAIEERLPDQSPLAASINSPSLDLHPELFEEYFNNIEFISCVNPDYPLDAIPVNAFGLCFYTDIKKFIEDFKVGIYADDSRQIIFIQEFNSSPPLGKKYTDYYQGLYGFPWQEFSIGDYQALFWIDDQLVKSIPFTLTGGRE